MFEGLLQPTHLLVILGIALLVFGPKKLPELGKGLGEGIRGFSDAAAAPAAQVYFTAGPNHGSGGLFGYLTAVPMELTEGNSQ